MPNVVDLERQPDTIITLMIDGELFAYTKRDLIDLTRRTRVSAPAPTAPGVHQGAPGRAGRTQASLAKSISWLIHKIKRHEIKPAEATKRLAVLLDEFDGHVPPNASQLGTLLEQLRMAVPNTSPLIDVFVTTYPKYRERRVD